MQGNETETIRDNSERAKIKEEIDQIVAEAYGLTDDDLCWILRSDTDDPRNLWRDYKQRLRVLGGEGKWGKLPQDDPDAVESS